MSTHLVALRLGDPGLARNGETDTDWLRRTLAESLSTLADVVEAGDTSGKTDVIAAVNNCRSALARGGPELEPEAAACFTAARNLAAQSRTRAAEQRTQVAALLAMVRETLTTVAGDQASLKDTLSESAERFEKIARGGDLQQIQARLLEEVTTLKRVTIERQAKWEATVQSFGSRLSQLESQLDHTRREASLDPLTNVANRRQFERTCREWVAPNRPGFVMMMADVDDFKLINDRYGHALGDRVLVTVADTLVRQLRTGDLVARLGGDEFAVLAAGLTLTQAQGRFAAIGRAVHQACQQLIPEGAAPSISIGLAECSAGDTLESLQRRSDEALYEAKKNGKGRVAAKASPLIRDLRKDK